MAGCLGTATMSYASIGASPCVMPDAEFRVVASSLGLPAGASLRTNARGDHRATLREDLADDLGQFAGSDPEFVENHRIDRVDERIRRSITAHQRSHGVGHMHDLDDETMFAGRLGRQVVGIRRDDAPQRKVGIV